MFRRFSSYFLIGLSAVAAHAQTPSEAKPMISGQKIEREIAAGDSHTYQISLKAGQFVRFHIDQQVIKSALILTAPDGKQLASMNPPGAFEQKTLWLEAATAGNYQLSVRGIAVISLDHGTYRLETTVQERATAEDRKRLAAQALLLDSFELFKEFKNRAQLITKLEPAIALLRDVDEQYWLGWSLEAISTAYSDIDQTEKGVVFGEQALAIYHRLKARISEGRLLNNLGGDYGYLGHPDKQLQYNENSLAAFRESKMEVLAPTSLIGIGNAYRVMGGTEKAIDFFQQALVLAREVKYKQQEANALYRLGEANGALKGYEKAIDYYQQALVIARESKDAQRESICLVLLGRAYDSLGRFEKAVEYYEQARSVSHAIHDVGFENEAIAYLADVYGELGQYEKAIEYLEHYLTANRENKERKNEAYALGHLGYTYRKLGLYPKAIDYYGQSSALYHEVKAPRDEAYVRVAFGDTLIDAGQFEKAIEQYVQAQAIFRENKIHDSEGDALGPLGKAYANLGQYEKAIEIEEQALAIFRETKYRESQRIILANLGEIWRSRGRSDLATTYHEQSLQIARELKYSEREAQGLKELMTDWKTRNENLAIYFGKQSVNTYQEIRNNMRTLDAETQRSFLKSKEQTYRDLADLLIAQGRLPEAEQVIRMLKEDEYFEYIRRDTTNAPQVQKAQLTPDETEIEKRYREIADQLAAIGAERGMLLEKKSRTPEEEQRLAKLEADLVVAGNTFQKFLTQLETKLGTSAEANAKVFAIRESQGLMEDLRELGKGTVALYTLVGDDKYRVILTTPDFQKGYEYPIKGTDLNRKVLEFREVLQNPKYDPLPLAQELYKILLGPVAKDLKAAKAQTLMWSLDGVLRYVPMAALNDGQKYLVEQYQNVVFTPASQARLKDVPARNWNALGLGVSKAQGAGIPALPGVIDEMRGIIRDETAVNAPGGVKQRGVLPGVVELDEQFTQQTMLTQLRLRPKVVHIASHFQFSPGNETNSALLLGDGTFLTLAQIKSLPNIFGGVDLLTLSACNTATGSSGANGKEVEGFAVLAQRQGAKAVVASLWPVADRSTMELMQDFYRLREATSTATKAEAIRQAQLRLLQGSALAATTATDVVAVDRQLLHEEDKTTGAKKLPFKPDAKKPYAHPYFWAPFILIGNWR